jgi:ribonuclease D
MSPSPLRPALITDQESLTALTGRLRRERHVALDTEAASFHRYIDRVYLVQVSSDHETALVDPLAVPDLGAIGNLLGDPRNEVIFHEADYDLRILHRDYGFEARNIWDTRIAAHLAGEPAVGLGSLLEKYFGVRLRKELQRADWSQRPLSDEMIAYAAADTAYLPDLRDALANELEKLHRLPWAEEEFQRLEGVRWSSRSPPGQEFLGLKGAKALHPPQLAILRALWQWRDAVARELDRAPFRVLANDLLVTLARAAPDSPAALAAVPGMSARVAARHGAALLEAVRAGRSSPAASWPRPERRPRERPDAAVEARMARLKALRAQRAEAVGLDPGLVGPNGVLAAIARAAPSDAAALDGVPDLRRWQREVLGDAALINAARAS